MRKYRKTLLTAPAGTLGLFQITGENNQEMVYIEDILYMEVCTAMSDSDQEEDNHLPPRFFSCSADEALAVISSKGYVNVPGGTGYSSLAAFLQDNGLVLDEQDGVAEARQ